MRSRMSPSEAIMWAVEKDPALRSDFANLTVVEGPLDEDRLRAKVTTMLDAIPRLRQRVVAPPLRLAPPEWKPDPGLDLDYHMRRVALPEPGGTRQLLDLVAALAAGPFDRSRPLWEFTLVEGLEGGRCALVQKVHHTIMDGVGGLRLSLSLVDSERNPRAGSPASDLAADAAAERAADERHDPIDRTSPLDVVVGAVADATRTNLGRARQGAAAAVDLAVHPGHLPGAIAAGVRLAGSVRRQVFVTDHSHSPLLAPRSLGRRFEILTVPFAPAKRAAATLGGSLNDLYVTAVTGALGAYHERMGVPCDDLRMAMPVHLHGHGEHAAANRFVPTRMVVPITPKDPAARFALVHAAIAGVRDEPALESADALASLLVPLPTALLVAATRSQVRTIDFATSNLRGSPAPLYLAGARIEANYPFGPRTGCALNITLLSYAGDLDLGINLDPVAITDAPAFLDDLRASFDALLSFDPGE